MVGCADLVGGVQRRGDDGAQGRGLPGRGQEREVEGLVHLVGAHVAGQARERLDPGLGHEGAVAVVLGQDLVPGAVDVVHALLVEHGARVARTRGAVLGSARIGAVDHRDRAVPVGQPVLLDHAVRDVDAEAVDALVEPEAQDVLELGADLGVVPVEVGLGRVEHVQVPLTRHLALGAGHDVRAGPCGHAGPGRAAEDRLPVVGGQLAVLTLAVAEQVPGALGRALGRRRAPPGTRHAGRRCGSGPRRR